MYVVSHPAPNECWDMVRTDGTRRDVVPGNPGLDARPTVGHVATDEPIAVAFATGGRRAIRTPANARTRAPPSSRIAQIDGSDVQQAREDAERFVPPKLRHADVENRFDGAMAVHEREEVRRPCIERQKP